jgi:myosin-crossreactive antigen
MFFWLLANDRLNTKDMLMRRSFNLNDNGLCRMCDDGLMETRDHLFWSCTFSLQCWQSINIKLEDNMDLSQMIATERSDFGKPFFFEDFATAAWNI